MERNVGTVSRGIRCPIIREGDNIGQIVVDSLLRAGETDGFEVRDRDVVCVTESVVARAQGNYASVDAIAADVKAKLGGETVGVIFPILSRNRFAICLRGIAKGAKKIVLIATGKNKAKAVYGLIKGEMSEAMPCSILQKHPDCTVYVDEEAYSLVK